MIQQQHHLGPFKFRSFISLELYVGLMWCAASRDSHLCIVYLTKKMSHPWMATEVGLIQPLSCTVKEITGTLQIIEKICFPSFHFSSSGILKQKLILRHVVPRLLLSWGCTEWQLVALRACGLQKWARQLRPPKLSCGLSAQPVSITNHRGHGHRYFGDKISGELCSTLGITTDRNRACGPAR